MEGDTGYQLFLEINKIRAFPQAIIGDVKNQLSRFQSSHVYRTQSGEKMRTKEGKNAWLDTIQAMQRQKVKPPLKWNPLLANACQIYAQQLAQGYDPQIFQIAKKLCNYSGKISFHINQSNIKMKIRELTLTLIIGDGEQGRSNRASIFHSTFNEFGACLIHTKNHGYISPMLFAQKVDCEGYYPMPTPAVTKTTEGISQGITSKGVTDVHPVQQKKQFATQYQPQLQNIGLELFQQINVIRKQPKQLVDPLKKQMGCIDQQKHQLVKDDVKIKLKEGKPAYEDAIDQLKQSFPIPPLKYSIGLSAACQDQCLNLINQKPSNFKQLSKKYTSTAGANMNTYTFTGNRSIEQLINSIIVCDGDKKRSKYCLLASRRCCLSPVLKMVGCAMVKQEDTGQYLTVICFSDMVKDYHDALQKRQQERMKGKMPKQDIKKVSQNQKQLQKQFGNFNVKQRKLQKKKAHTKYITRDGQRYKVITTILLYDNGQEQQDQQEIRVH